MGELTMINFNVKSLLEKNNISRYKLQKLTNWNYKRINAYYNGTVKLISVDEIDTLCKILKCNVEDLFKYSKD